MQQKCRNAVPTCLFRGGPSKRSSPPSVWSQKAGFQETQILWLSSPPALRTEDGVHDETEGLFQGEASERQGPRQLCVEPRSPVPPVKVKRVRQGCSRGILGCTPADQKQRERERERVRAQMFGRVAGEWPGCANNILRCSSSFRLLGIRPSRHRLRRRY